MKTLTLLTVALGLAAGPVLTSAAFAQDKRVSDVTYLRAMRCEGLAVGSRQPDPAIAAFVKDAQGWRSAGTRDRGDQIFADARREGARNKERAQAELAGACQAFRAPVTTAAN